MSVTVTFRHMEATEAVRDYAVEKLERLHKYVEWPLDFNVVLSTEKYHHVVEITGNTRGGTFKCTERSEDMYASIDSATDKIERQVLRHKEKLVRRKGGSSDWDISSDQD